MKKIALSQGKFALVDDVDYEWLMQWRWCFDAGYAKHSQYLGGGRKNTKIGKTSMHRLILGAKKGEEVDHINRNKLDNTRKNLRIATRSQNCRNMGGKGYYWQKSVKKWHAQININGKYKHLGLFTVESDAREAYLVEYNKCFE